jgi:hypothetical protein
MGERDEFDEIVQHLDLDLDFPDPSDERSEPDVQPPTNPAARSSDVGEEFYRRVDPGPRRPWRRNVTAAWIGLVGSPAALVVCSLAGYIAPRSIVAALALTFVAAAVYLIAQLPDRPSGGPDDGAVV